MIVLIHQCLQYVWMKNWKTNGSISKTSFCACFTHVDSLRHLPDNRGNSLTRIWLLTLDTFAGVTPHIAYAGCHSYCCKVYSGMCEQHICQVILRPNIGRAHTATKKQWKCSPCHTNLETRQLLCKLQQKYNKILFIQRKEKKSDFPPDFITSS